MIFMTLLRRALRGLINSYGIEEVRKIFEHEAVLHSIAEGARKLRKYT